MCPVAADAHIEFDTNQIWSHPELFWGHWKRQTVNVVTSCASSEKWSKLPSNGNKPFFDHTEEYCVTDVVLWKIRTNECCRNECKTVASIWLSVLLFCSLSALFDPGYTCLYRTIKINYHDEASKKKNKKQTHTHTQKHHQVNC